MQKIFFLFNVSAVVHRMPSPAWTPERKQHAKNLGYVGLGAVGFYGLQKGVRKSRDLYNKKFPQGQKDVWDWYHKKFSKKNKNGDTIHLDTVPDYTVTDSGRVIFHHPANASGRATKSRKSSSKASRKTSRKTSRKSSRKTSR